MKLVPHTEFPRYLMTFDASLKKFSAPELFSYRVNYDTGGGRVLSMYLLSCISSEPCPDFFTAMAKKDTPICLCMI